MSHSLVESQHLYRKATRERGMLELFFGPKPDADALLASLTCFDASDAPAPMPPSKRGLLPMSSPRKLTNVSGDAPATLDAEHLGRHFRVRSSARPKNLSDCHRRCSMLC